MKGQINFFNVLSVIVLAGLTYACPVYAGEDGHSRQDGHEMEHGTAPHSPEDKMIISYLKIQANLANDTLDGVTSEAKKIIEQSGLIEKKQDKHSGHKESGNSQLNREIGKQAAHLSHGEIEDIRKQFATLSHTFIQYLEKSGSEKKLFTFFCPMKKQYWLQDNDKAANPFLGKKMSSCGNIVPGIEKKDMSAMGMSHDSNKDNGHGQHGH